MDFFTAASTITFHGIPSSSFRKTLPLKTLRPPSSFVASTSRVSARISASSSSTPNIFHRSISTAAAGTLILAASVLAGKFPPPPARADPSPPPDTVELAGEEEAESESEETHKSPLSNFLESNSEGVAALRSLLYRKLEEGDDSDSLSILRRLMSAQPLETEWKFLAARLLNEMGDPSESRRIFEEILAVDPFSFEALFENAVLMDQCGEGPAVIERLERALELARSEGQEKAARDIRLIVAQIQFLQKNVDEALASYEELAKEDPKDYRPYFCQGVIYSLSDRNKEAREKFAKYHELSPRKFEVDGFLQTPLSRMKLFGTEDSQV